MTDTRTMRKHLAKHTDVEVDRKSDVMTISVEDRIRAELNSYRKPMLTNWTDSWRRSPLLRHADKESLSKDVFRP